VDGLGENVVAGGDSAARGLAAGMLLGAHAGMAAIPKQWLAGLQHREEIERLMDGLRRPF
jgi:ADP-ribosylglycohydrolase